ncbi:hypothetical protein Tco_0293778, partial [Tanacetum coccineum]
MASIISSQVSIAEVGPGCLAAYQPRGHQSWGKVAVKVQHGSGGVGAAACSAMRASMDADIGGSGLTLFRALRRRASSSEGTKYSGYSGSGTNGISMGAQDQAHSQGMLGAQVQAHSQGMAGLLAAWGVH